MSNFSEHSQSYYIKFTPSVNPELISMYFSVQISEIRRPKSYAWLSQWLVLWLEKSFYWVEWGYEVLRIKWGYKSSVCFYKKSLHRYKCILKTQVYRNIMLFLIFIMKHFTYMKRNVIFMYGLKNNNKMPTHVLTTRLKKE